MTSSLRILSAAALAAAALAAPTAAQANPSESQALGSSLDTSRGVADSIDCAAGCTFAFDTVGSQIYADVGYPNVAKLVTRFKARLAPGTTATIRAFQRGGYGAMTPTHTGETVTGTGRLETYESHMPIARNETIGLDLQGSLAAIKDTGTIRVLDYRTPDGTRSETDGYDLEPLLQATVETDSDGDGLGDATQDPCWQICDIGGGASSGGPAQIDSGSSADGSGAAAGAGSSSGGSSTGAGPASKGSPRANENIRSRHVLTVQEDGMVTRARKPVATAYLYNPHDDSVTGTATLKVGGKVVSKTRAYASTIDELPFKVSRKVAAKLAKGMKGTVTANVSSDENGKESDTYGVAFKPAVTTAYDGDYRAKGPVVIKVRNGIVESATASLFASSTNGSGSLTRAFYLPTGVPAVIGKDGRVEVHGHAGSDEVRFKAVFRRNGTIKGYISLWYYQLGSGYSGVQVTPFLGASNWVARKQ